MTIKECHINEFHEGNQNHLALAMIRHFCVSAGISWGQGLGVGAGGMVGASPLGHGPLRSIGLALDSLSDNIQRNVKDDDFFTMPNFPRSLYRIGGHHGWIKEAKKNGLKREELYNQL